MKRKWIYGLLIAVLVIGLVYVVWNSNEDQDKVADNDEVETEIDEETDIAEEPVVPETPEVDENTPVDEGEEEKESTEFPDIVVGAKLPDFTLETLKGEKVNLRELEGKIVVLNFWATWCPYCVQEMPDLQKLKENNDDMVLLTINVDEEKDKVEKYIKDGGYDFQVLLDKGGEISSQYFVTGLPATYFINEEGLFVGRIPSAMDYEQMEEALGVTRDY